MEENNLNIEKEENGELSEASVEEITEAVAENTTEKIEESVTESAAEEAVPQENLELPADDFSFFLSVLDENSEDYEWAKNQLDNTESLNDMVEEYDAAVKLREEAAAAAEKARLEAEAAERARIEAEEAEKTRLEEEARRKAEEETRIREEEIIRAKAAEEAHKARVAAEEAEKVRLAAEEAERRRAEQTETEKNTEPIVEESFDENGGVDGSEEQDSRSESAGETETGELTFGDEDEGPIDEEEFFAGRRRKKMDDRLAKLEAGAEHQEEPSKNFKARFDSIFGSSKGKKELKVFGIPRNVFGVITVILFAVDMFLMNIASYKIVYFLMEKLLVSNGVEALRLSDAEFSKIFVGVSYVASFLLGGIAVLLVSKLAENIIRGIAFANGRAVTMSVVGVFALFFLVGAAVMALMSGNILSLTVYRWAGPLLTYLGGLLFIAISKVNLSIDY